MMRLKKIKAKEILILLLACTCAALFMGSEKNCYWGPLEENPGQLVVNNNTGEDLALMYFGPESGRWNIHSMGGSKTLKPGEYKIKAYKYVNGRPIKLHSQTKLRVPDDGTVSFTID